MPLKNGRMTQNEKVVARAMAETGSLAYARMKSGMSAIGVAQAVVRPAVHAEIASIQQGILFAEALPAAVKCLISIISSDKMPAGARVQAAKIVLDRTLGADDARQGKEPHEMSGEELAEAIAKLERIASERAKPVEIVEPVEIVTQVDVFG